MKVTVGNWDAWQFSQFSN